MCATSRPRLLCMVPWLPEAARRIVEAACEVVYAYGDRDRMLTTIHRYDALWVHFDQQADAAVLARAQRLKLICTATTGTDHIDKDEAARRGIRVLSIARDRGLLDTFTATAECGWMLLLACSRHFRAATRAAHTGDWREGAARFEGRQLAGRTLGIVGLGRLGSMSAGYGRAFRMRVLGCDTRDINLTGVENVAMNTLLAESDAVTIHIHLTPENRHLFNDAAFARMRPGAVLVNTSRGDIVDETALIRALDAGHLRAYGADVVSDEWRDDMTTHPLVAYAAEHDNVVLTPHLGGSTAESVVAARTFAARKLVHFLRTGDELAWPAAAGQGAPTDG